MLPIFSQRLKEEVFPSKGRGTLVREELFDDVREEFFNGDDMGVLSMENHDDA